jgi:hypothetical protein
MVFDNIRAGARLSDGLELGFIHVALHTVAAEAEWRRAACVFFDTRKPTRLT